MKFKQLVEELTKMIENQESHHFKQKAYKELADINLIDIPNVRFILDDYPDFDSICFKFTQPDVFIVKININYNELKGNPKAIKKCAKMIYKYMKNKETL